MQDCNRMHIACAPKRAGSRCCMANCLCQSKSYSSPSFMFIAASDMVNSMTLILQLLVLHNALGAPSVTLCSC